MYHDFFKFYSPLYSSKTFFVVFLIFLNLNDKGVFFPTAIYSKRYSDKKKRRMKMEIQFHMLLLETFIKSKNVK